MLDLCFKSGPVIRQFSQFPSFRSIDQKSHLLSFDDKSIPPRKNLWIQAFIKCERIVYVVFEFRFIANEFPDLIYLVFLLVPSKATTVTFLWSLAAMSIFTISKRFPILQVITTEEFERLHAAFSSLIIRILFLTESYKYGHVFVLVILILGFNQVAEIKSKAARKMTVRIRVLFYQM